MKKSNRKKNRGLKYILIFLISLAVIAFVFENTSKLMFPVKYKEYIVKYSAKYNLDPYLVLAMIKAESNFHPDAVSPKNARGLMQIIPKTGFEVAKFLGIEDYSEESLFIPEINISIGCWYLKDLLKEFGGDVDLAVIAYNGGRGNVNEWLSNSNYSSSGKILDMIPFKETENYLKRVKEYHLIYKKLYENIF